MAMAMEQEQRRARLWRSSLGEVREMEQKLAAMEGRLEAAARERLPVLEAATEPVAAIAMAASSFTSHLDSAIARTSSLLKTFSSIRSLHADLSSLDPRLHLPDFLHLVCSMEASLLALPDLYRSTMDHLHRHTLPSLQHHRRSHLLDPYSLQKLSDELARSKRLAGDPLQEILASLKPLDKALLKLEAEFERLLTDGFRVVDLRAFVQDPEEGDGAADPASDNDKDRDRGAARSAMERGKNRRSDDENRRTRDKDLALDEDRRPKNAATTTMTELVDPDTINKILVIADRLKANGRIEVCIAAYKEIRVRAVRKSMATLKPGYLASFSAEKLEGMKWEEVHESIYRWGRDVKAIVGVLLAAERELCGRAFCMISEADRIACFADIATRSNVAVFFRYARAVAETKHRPEALLVGLLDLLGGLSSIKFELAAAFEGCPEVLRSVGEMKKSVAHNVARALAELAASVEAKRTPVPGDGGKDLNASFVVNYMGMIVREYKQAAEEALRLYEQAQGEARRGSMPAVVFSSLKNAALGMMNALERSLEQRAHSHPHSHSGAYHYPALAHLFLMNNYRHVLVRLKECIGLADCLGDDFKLAWRHKVDLNMRSYIKSSWEPVISTLSRDGLHHSSGSVNRDLVAKKVAAFNEAFEHVYWAQLKWVILDDVLRDNVYLSVIQLLVPAYHNFLQLYAAYLEDGVPLQLRVHKYTVEMVENMVRNLFQGGR